MKDKPTRYFSSRQEKAVARTVGGKVVANSGATQFSKGDVRLDNMLIECKTKTSPAESFSIKREWLEKNEEEAFAMGKDYSALCFNFGDYHNTRNYYVIDENLFKKLLTTLKEESENEG